MRELQAQGMPEGQATLISDSFHELQDEQVTREYLHAELATNRAELRQEMAMLRAELRQEMAELRQEMMELRAELRQKMAQLRIDLEAIQRRMMMWLTPILAAQVGTIAGVVGLLMK